MLSKEDCIVELEGLLPRFAKSFQTGSRLSLADLNITIPQLHVLMQLSHNDNCKTSDLSKALNVTLPNITAMIDRLIKEGFVARAADKLDRRIVRIKLSKKGQKLIANHTKHRRVKLSTMLEKMNAGEIKAMFDIMKKVISQTS